ncbi:MAG: UDP-2,3-diacylglucosamine diphosphatase [Bacteroidia bacterium]
MKNKIYFISDFHLGVPDSERSLEREKKIVRWLDMINGDASELYLLGDVFDFWFEYKHAVPRGYVRLLGKLAELSDSGIKIYYFTGNHDMWVFDYIPKEIGATLYREPITRTYSGKKFLIGHGDGLGPGDHGYKFIKKVFASKTCQWLFARFHPNFGTWLANYFSRKSRIATGTSDEVYHGDDKEFLMIFCNDYIKKEHIDYFIFGHRHLVLDKKIGTDSRYINLGEWITQSSYAVFDGEKLELKKFE